MALVPPTFMAGVAIDPATTNTWNTQVAALLNGGLTKDNLAGAAGVLTSQLAASYEHLNVTLRYGTGTAIPTAWPGGNAKVAFENVAGTTGDAGGDWVATQLEWLCTDTGDAAGTGAFSVLWGGYSAGVWVAGEQITVLGSTTMTNSAAGAQSTNSGIVTAGFPVTLTRRAYPCFLTLVSAAAGANLLSAAIDQIVVTVRLRRAIAAT